MPSVVRALGVVLVWTAMSASPLVAQHPQAFIDQAEQAFADDRLADAVAAFDRLVALDPEAGPWMWQRGIALYYLGRFEACAAQFAAYQGVNPGDLESAVWHTACLARAESIEAARAAMFPPGRDPRVMRAEVYEMFAGRLSPGTVIDRAGFVGEVAVFYARFYAALFAEVTGDQAAIRRHLRVAASEVYRDYGGFMNVVAQRHWARVQAAPEDSGTASDEGTRRTE